jgi:hypothetical protein
MYRKFTHDQKSNPLTLTNYSTLYMTDRHYWLIIYVTLRILYCLCIPVSFGTPITTEGVPNRLDALPTISLPYIGVIHLIELKESKGA